MTIDPNEALVENSYLAFFKSITGIIADKIVSALAAFSALVLGSIAIPISEAVFRQYSPVSGYVQSYWEYCTGIALLTILTWMFTLPSRPGFSWAFHIILCAAAFVLSGMMRTNMGLPNIVWIQFLLYFAGVVIACEMLLIAFVQGVLKAIRVVQKRKSIPGGTGSR